VPVKVHINYGSRRKALGLTPFGMIATTLDISGCALRWAPSSPSSDYVDEVD
jgi:hypothetical protein